MRLLRFNKTIKLIFAILLAFGFSTTTFANGGGAGDANVKGCGKNNEVKCAGPKYRCFKHYGHTKSYTPNYDDNQTDKKWTKLFGKYCLPKVSIWCDTKSDGTTCNKNNKDDLVDADCNMKEWDWSLDYKNDTVKETERSLKTCKFLSCELNGSQWFWFNQPSTAYHIFYQVDNPPNNEPIDVYFYCANAATDFYQVAKCVDKQTGKDANSSQCDKDILGTRYYYKPNCNSEGDCTNKMANWIKDEKLKMCYNPWKQTADSNVIVFEENAGGQTVGFSQFQFRGYQQYSGPCSYTPWYRTNFTLDGSTEPADPSDIIIMDEDDNRDDTLVHTKISGNEYFFKIKEKTNDADAGANTKAPTCKIEHSEDGTVLDQSAEIITQGIMSRAINLITGRASKVEYRFPAKALGAFVPKKSGKYTITCGGNGYNTASDSFIVAPYSYDFGIINAVFDDTKGSQKENLLTKKQDVKYNTDPKTIESKFKITHTNDNWKKKPVVKIGQTLSLQITDLVTRVQDGQNKSGGLDEGVSYQNGVGGTISVADSASLIGGNVNLQNIHTTLGITDANKLPNNGHPDTSQNAGCVGKVDITKLLASTNAPMTNGAIDATAPQPILQILTKDDAIVGQIDAVVYDIAMQQLIAEEQGKKRCNDNTKYPCPYPGKLQLTFEYQIVPNNFKIEISKDGDPVKVLYFGQGTSPAVEEGTDMKIIPLKEVADITKANTDVRDPNNDIASNFKSGCAAQNLQISMGAEGNGFAIGIVDKDGNPYSVVKATDFGNDGIAETEAIIKVGKTTQKDANGNVTGIESFTPSMKSEPVFISAADTAAGFPAEISFQGYPINDSYYPQFNAPTNPGEDMVILRARINAIDTDNVGGFGAPSDTRVWYEFQCEYCNIDQVAKVTNWNYNSKLDRSPTQQGWWIDRTFGKHNSNHITANKATIESGGLRITGVDPTNSVIVDDKNEAGSQKIRYGNASQGTYKLNILHGNFTDNNTSSGIPIAMPYFLLYNAYWTGTDKDVNGNQIPLLSTIQWNTSSFVYVKGNTKDDPRDYGVDTKGAKNTRSGGRTGKF